MPSVRLETPEDIEAIRRVNRLAFGESGEADLVDSLRARGVATISLVAQQESLIVGHILFSPAAIEGDSGKQGLGLGPMAVLPEFQNRGIGSRLVRAGLDCCRDRGHTWVVVLGHATYYPRFGFIPASKFGLRCEYDVPDEVFMAIELREGALKGRGGLVKYQPEFNEV